MKKMPQQNQFDAGLRSLVRTPEFITHIAGGDNKVGTRLVESDAMKSVWKMLGKHLEYDDEGYQDGRLYYEFIEFAARLRKNWSRMNKSPKTEIRKDAEEIAELAKSLGRKLRAHADTIYFYSGVGTDLLPAMESVWKRDRKLSEATIAALKADIRLLDKKAGCKAIPSTYELLEGLAKSIKNGITPSHLALRPTKPNASTAERTYCVHALAEFFEEKTGSRQYSLIAKTVSTIFKKPITSNHVQKLIP